MNQNFIDYVKSHIKEYLPTEYQNAVISINEVTKSNDRMLTGLTILLPGEQAAPTIYLEALAEQVERGMPLDTAMKQIAQIQLENYSRVPLNISMLENYEAVRPMLAVQMCDPETNQEYLKGKPYTSCGELAAYYRIQVAADEEGTAYINGVLVSFTSTELSILKLLLQYPQKIFSKQNLYESIWNEPYAYDDDTINTHISHIRKKIKSITNEDYIQTIWGIGYKMK